MPANTQAVHTCGLACDQLLGPFPKPSKDIYRYTISYNSDHIFNISTFTKEIQDLGPYLLSLQKATAISIHIALECENNDPLPREPILDMIKHQTSYLTRRIDGFHFALEVLDFTLEVRRKSRLESLQEYFRENCGMSCREERQRLRQEIRRERKLRIKPGFEHLANSPRESRYTWHWDRSIGDSEPWLLPPALSPPVEPEASR
jgi:hypothetical protein